MVENQHSVEILALMHQLQRDHYPSLFNQKKSQKQKAKIGKQQDKDESRGNKCGNLTSWWFQHQASSGPRNPETQKPSEFLDRKYELSR